MSVTEHYALSLALVHWRALQWVRHHNRIDANNPHWYKEMADRHAEYERE